MKTVTETPEDDRQRLELIHTLKTRFERNRQRHAGLDWEDIQARLEANPAKLRALYEMEKTGGEPDVVWQDEQSGEYVFCDCSAESPAGRRNLCYDEQARRMRKDAPPAGSAVGMAEAMGIELLDEEQYRRLQTLGEFDTKTSSWLKTPPAIRERGGAIFGDRRYDHVFIYHNGASSYYAARGFRGFVRV